jgi:hypothetical protein
VVVDQSVQFARGLRATEFVCFGAGIQNLIWGQGFTGMQITYISIPEFFENKLQMGCFDSEKKGKWKYVKAGKG